jgi:predicted RNA-binding protein Jag
VGDLRDADVLLTLKSHAKRQTQKIREAAGRNVEVHVIRSNTLKQMENFLREIFGITEQAGGGEDNALHEVEEAVIDVLEHRRPVELSPQPKQLRRIQHLYAERSGLLSESRGREPLRRVVIFPQR